MTDTLTGAKLAETIEKVVTMLPDNHDQGFWFYTYEAPNSYQPVDPDSIKLVQILDAVEAGKEAAKEIKCNTTLCTAGWALMLNGYKLVRKDYDDFAEKDGKRYDIFKKAQELLEIDRDTADVLFDGDTSNDDAVEMLYAISTNDTDTLEALVSRFSRCGCGCEDDDEDYDY